MFAQRVQSVDVPISLKFLLKFCDIIPQKFWKSTPNFDTEIKNYRLDKNTVANTSDQNYMPAVNTA